MTEFFRQETSRIRWFILAAASWTVLAAIPTSSAYIADGSLGLARWFGIFLNIAPYYYLWALVTPFIYRLCQTHLSPERSWLKAILGHAGIAVTLSFVFGYVLHFNNRQEWLFGSIAPGYYTMSAFSYLFILLGIYFYSMQQKIRKQYAEIADQNLRQQELETSLARSQVELLRGQMNPHFLFNALNCIGALIETRQNDRAYEALEDLGSLLRTSLEHRNQELVPLSDELAFARRYIAMEQVRFGDRLALEIDVDSAAAQWQVPPFILQPLIENTVKHAVAPSHRAVKVSVTGRRTAEGIELEVRDNGGSTVKNSHSGGTGVGLENLRMRLNLVYGDRGSLKFHQDDEGTCVSLRIPDRKEAKPEIQKVKESIVLPATHVQAQP